MIHDDVKDLLTNRRLSRRTLVGGTAAALALPSLLHARPNVSAQDGGKEFHSAYPYEVPPKGHFNLMQGVTHGIMLPAPTNLYADLIIQPFALYYWKEAKWLPLMATEWAFEGTDTFSLTLRQGAKWSDGNEFTSKDVLTSFWCARITSNTLWKYVDRIDAPDPYTVKFHMSQPSTVVERYVLRFNTLSDVTYGEWAKQAQDLFNSGKTIDDPEGRQLLQNFTNFRPPDVIASGPFKFDTTSITQAQLTLVKNPTAWNADQVLFDKIVNYNGETPDITPVVLSKDVDYATHGFPPATEQAMQQAGIRVLRPPVYNGPALFFNHAKLGNVFGNKLVRQAIAMAINRDQNGTVALGASGVGVKRMAGFSDNAVPNWIAEADVAALNPYPYDQARATSMLEELGWTKGGDGVWTTQDGTRAEFEIIFPAEFADWSAAGQDVADQLTAFGIKVAPRAVTYTQQPVDVDKGNFQLAIQQWGNSSNPHPHFSFTNDFFLHNYPIAINNGGRGMDFPLEQTTDTAGAVNIEKLVLDSANGLDENAQKANVTTIAKVFNELLPIIPLFERYGNNAALEGTRVQAWPADDDPLLQNSPYADGIVTILMLTGGLKPV